MPISAFGLSAAFSLVVPVLAAQSPDGAQPGSAAPPATAGSDFGSDQDGTGGKPGKKNKNKDKNPDKDAGAESLKDAIAAAIEVKGRVFFLAEYRDEMLESGQGSPAVNNTAFTLSLPSARAGFKANVRPGISVTIEADFAGGRASIRDGYVQAKNKRFTLRAGRFKMPLSAFTLESPWRLPRAQRGVLDDVLSEHMLLSGRREGLMGRWEGGGFWDLAMTAGVFQSTNVFQAKHLTSVLRLSTEPRNTEIALVGLRRSTLVAGQKRAFNSAGVDLTSTDEVFGLGTRAWAEFYAGESWFHQPAAGTDAQTLSKGPAATYFQGRVMAAVRTGGVERDEHYAELFLSGGFLDPDVEVIQDYFLEVSAGINIGHWQTTRLTFEVVRAQSGRNFPDTIFLDAAVPAVAERTAALLQLGAAF
jgi:hypothetical protein